MSITNILSLIGGLGFFLYGMKLMSVGMENVAGSKMKSILEFCTRNRLTGVIVGALFTAVIQSSSATTVMVVSFVNSGFMSLVQSLGVIMGANIGTAVTGQIVSFDLEAIAPVFILVGVIMHNFSKKPMVNKVGEVVLGFGILFFGIGTMKDSITDLDKLPQMQTILEYMKNPLIGILIGLIVTSILQSSSAAVGILISMAAAGVFTDIESAFCIIAGTNIGACTSAVLASFGGKKEAKRVALSNVLFNILSMLVLILLYIPLHTYWNDFIMTISPARTEAASMARALANDQTLIKILQVVITFPFANLIIKLSELIIRGEDKEAEPCELKYINQTSAITPTNCILEATREINRMGVHAIENLDRSISMIYKYDDKKLEQIYETEKQIDYLSKAISDYLVKVSQSGMPVSDGKYIAAYFHVVNDLERIGDHAENIAEFARKKHEDNIEFSAPAVEELKTMCDKVILDVKLSLSAFINRDDTNLETLAEMEDSINKMENKLQKHHVVRMTKNMCDPNSVIFSDMVSNLERVADHANNIAFAMFNKYELD